ncbi:MAG: hypothetical protein NDI70_03305, partial [Pseudomonas sagittaria]|nr:hypothetical protein [Pseudomonas sagittaria]
IRSTASSWEVSGFSLNSSSRARAYMGRGHQQVIGAQIIAQAPLPGEVAAAHPKAAVSGTSDAPAFFRKAKSVNLDVC